jgi:phage baseplate assembly protein W
MTARYGAWRFTFRTLDGQAHPAGFSLSPKGAIELAHDADVVRQAILLLISTRPGERVMRPGYGCYLFRLAFSPNDDTTAGLAIHYVRQALERWEPRIEVQSVGFDLTQSGSGLLTIDIGFKVRATNTERNLVYPFYVIPAEEGE